MQHSLHYIYIYITLLNTETVSTGGTKTTKGLQYTDFDKWARSRAEVGQAKTKLQTGLPDGSVTAQTGPVLPGAQQDGTTPR